MSAEEIETVTTTEAAHMLGISDRTFRRWIARKGIEPVIVGGAPGEQNRYDRRVVEALSGKAAQNGLQKAENGLTGMADNGLGELRAMVMSVKRDVNGRSDALAGQLTAIDVRLERLEQLLQQPPKRPWWRWWG